MWLRREDPSRPGRWPITMIEGMTDPEFLEAAVRRREQAERNAAWLEAHGDDVFDQYRGQCICVSEGDVFAGGSAIESLMLAEAAHPDDGGRLLCQVPAERATRISAYRG